MIFLLRRAKNLPKDYRCREKKLRTNKFFSQVMWKKNRNADENAGIHKKTTFGTNAKPFFR